MPKFFPLMVTELDPVFALLNEVRTLREPKSHENTCETNADSEFANAHGLSLALNCSRYCHSFLSC